MTSYLFPSSPWTTVAILLVIYCIPGFYLGLICKYYILSYMLLMLIGYVFSGNFQKCRTKLEADKNSYALVTGASSGIGAQICRRLAKHDFNLIIVARSLNKLNELADEIRRSNAKLKVHVIRQDLTEYGAVEKLTSQIDALENVRIDILVNNAGKGCTKLFLDTTAEDQIFNQMIALHVNVPLNLIRHYLPQMAGRPSRIVNISSIISYMSSPRAIIYASTKAFLTQMTTALDYEIQQNDEYKYTKCLLVTPGPTLDTNFDRQNQSLVFFLPFVTKTAQQVAEDVVEASLCGRDHCITGFGNQFVVWISTKVPVSIANLVCWILWGSWSEVKQWLYLKRHIIMICANLTFLLFLLAGFVIFKIIRQIYFYLLL